jgi:hypothetical protein
MSNPLNPMVKVRGGGLLWLQPATAATGLRAL